MFSCAFATLGAKNTVNTDVFGGLEAQNLGIYDVFLPLVAKNTVFTVFFGQHLAKTLIFTLVSPCCKMYCSFYIRKGQAYCKLQCFGFALRVRGGAEGVCGGCTEMTSNLVNNQVTGLAPSPLLRKAKLKVTPLELPFVLVYVIYHYIFIHYNHG